MAKKVFIIHCWAGSPTSDWFIWIKQELKSRGFEVVIPQMPNTETPKIDEWIPFLEKTIKNPDNDTYFIGHSIGCQAIMRYLQDINIKVGGILFVAGWLSLQDLETKEEAEIAESWLTTSINFDKVKQNIPEGKITALFSLDDPWVPISDSSIFHEKLGAKTITEKEAGHFNGPKYPEILEEFLKIANQ